MEGSRIRLRAVVFDFDDTLAATRRTRLSLLRKAALHFGTRVTRQEILAHWGKPFDLLISGFLPNVDFDRFKRWYIVELRRTPPRPLPGARSLLALLAERGVAIHVLSSGSRSLVKQDLQAAKLWPYLTALWCYEDTTHHKPHRAVLAPALHSLAEVGIRSREAAYVGDSLDDLRVAKRNGLPFWGVLTGLDSRRDFLRAGLSAARIFPSLHRLMHSRSLASRLRN